MPRMSLPAAALAVLVAAWSAQPVHADSGRAVRHAPKSSSETNTSEKSGSNTPRLFAPLAKLKQLATGEKPSAKKSSSTTTAASKPTASQSDASRKVATSQAAPASKPRSAEPRSNIRLVAGEAEAPAPRPLPPGPAAVFPGTVAVQPAYSPLPGYRNDPGVAVVPGYPYLNAPLNTTPVPNVPYQVGSTAITNQAFYPQEMLYPHKYRALYPPFYHKVRGHWIVTPWGVWSNDRWELQGTEVKVNYRANYSPFSLFHPPHLK